MNIPKTARAMAYLDDGIISDAAEEATPAKKRAKVRWLVAAACLCLALGSTALATVSQHPVKIRELNDDIDVYSVEAQLEKLPVADFTGPMMQELPEVFVRQIEAAAQGIPNLDNGFRLPPYILLRDYDSAAEAADYIGLGSLILPDWDYAQKRTVLQVQCDEVGNITSVLLETWYADSSLAPQFKQLQTRAMILTENTSGRTSLGAKYGGYDNGGDSSQTTFTQSAYTAANGTECVLITLDVPSEGLLYTDCYLAYGGILYGLSVSYAPEDATCVEPMIEQWADMFP